MHELSIATAILESVEKEAALRPAARVVAVGVRIGELSGVDANSLAFGWEAILKGTDHEGLKLELQMVPWTNRCIQCEHEFRVVDYRTECPVCGSLKTKLVGGEELGIAYIEIEESEAAQA